MAKLDFASSFKKVEKHLIGIWRFKRLNEEKLWCATFEVEGEYYDVEGYADPVEALKRVYKDIQLVKREKRHNTA